jgi:hypothetical protein
MHQAPALKRALKRGALITAANWPVVLAQFVVEALFKGMLAVPVLGGAALLGLVLGGASPDRPQGDWRESVPEISAGLVAHPVALAAFLTAFGVVLLAGATLVFLVKAGTVTVLAAGEAGAGDIERPPLRLRTFRRASRFAPELAVSGCRYYFRRFFRLGLVLLAVYAVSGGAYIVVVFGAFSLTGEGAGPMAWTAVAALCSTALLVWITLINLCYVLVQMVIVVDDRDVRSAFRQVLRFLRHRGGDVAAIFGVTFLLVILATGVSLLAATGLGLIAFVPLVGLAAVPLQVCAWLLRGLVFHYLGLAALTAYLTQYRSFLAAAGSADVRATEASSPTAPWVRTA